MSDKYQLALDALDRKIARELKKPKTPPGETRGANILRMELKRERIAKRQYLAALKRARE